MESIFEIYIFFSNEAAKEQAINGTDFKASQKVYPGFNYHPIRVLTSSFHCVTF